jgi:trehalose-6-phosphatase
LIAFYYQYVAERNCLTRVNAREGISIKIGEGSTLARFRAEGVREFRDWLDELAAETREWHAV